MRRPLVALAALLTLPTLAGAVEKTPVPHSGGLQLWSGLAIVMAVILLLYGAARRWLKWPVGGRSGVIRICETRALGPKKSLCLVRVRDRELLLGVTGERIALLSDMPVPAEAAREEPFEQTLLKRMKDKP